MGFLRAIQLTGTWHCVCVGIFPLWPSVPSFLTCLHSSCPSRLCQVNPTNLIGLLVNSCGIGWYAAEKYRESRSKALKHTAHKSPQPGAKAGDADDDDGKDAQGLMTLTRDGSQVQDSKQPCSIVLCFDTLTACTLANHTPECL